MVSKIIVWLVGHILYMYSRISLCNNTNLLVNYIIEMIEYMFRVLTEIA